MVMDALSLYDQIGDCAKYIKLDFTSGEMAELADKNNFSEESLKAISDLFIRLKEKKQNDILEFLLNTSRLPLKVPKTFENYDFSRIRGKDVESLVALQSISEVYIGKNIALIGPPGVGKTHLAEAYGRKCCECGLKTYMLKASELGGKFRDARKFGRESKCLNYLVKPSCLIIDEIGRHKFDRESTAQFFDLVDRRYQKESPQCMIFTSNKQPSEWLEFFDCDDDLRAALDRIFDDAKVFNIKGKSYRGQKLDIFSLEAGPETTSEQYID